VQDALLALRVEVQNGRAHAECDHIPVREHVRSICPTQIQDA
jgi:hypothetical protein